MKVVKISGIILLVLLALAWVGTYLGVAWVNKNLESIINAKPDRKYDFKFNSLDFDLFKRVILISDVQISAIGEQAGVYVEGHVSQVLLNKLDLKKLYLNREVDIKELMFSNPEFVIHMPLENPTNENAGGALKGLFGDILSRGGIDNFELGQANAEMLMDGKHIGSLSNLNIVATDLHTDSLKWNYPIPFDYGRITISIDSMDYLIANGKHLKMGKIEFDTRINELKLGDISLKYVDGIRKASTDMKFQVDLIEFELSSLIFSGLEANSNLYSNPDIRARKLQIEGLELEDFRNKNLPRPKEEIKPLFLGMLKKITFPLKLDTLKIINSAIVYGESVPGQNEYWKISFDQLNGEFVNVTTIPEYQAIHKFFGGKINGKVKGNGVLNLTLEVPYDKEEFDMEIDLANFPLLRINDLLTPVMNGKIITGDLVRMNLKLHADTNRSTNVFRFDYTDLKLELFKKEERRKNKILSVLANTVVHTSNMPSDRRYRTAEYVLARNPYRGPFFMLWQSTKEGMGTIVPGGAAKEFLKNPDQ